MKCPFCSNLDDKVVDSRESKDGTSIRRRRECLKCGRRYTSYERCEQIILMVVKKDGRREPFDRNKIRNGLIKACEKRPVSMEAIDMLVDDIETMIYNKMEKEVRCSEIGKMVMRKLQNIDRVAYVRFASVYQDFKDINQFMEELKKILS